MQVKEITKQIIQFTLNNPQKRNPLSLELIIEFKKNLVTIENSKNYKVLIVDSQGPAFSAGHDLKEIKKFQKEDPSKIQNLFEQCIDLCNTLQEIPLITIASVQGITTAAGMQILGACDLAIASPNAKFGLTGIHAGLFCISPSSFLINKVNPKFLFDLLVTGNFINSEVALKNGLITRISSSHENLEEESIKYCQEIAQFPQSSLQIGKQYFQTMLKNYQLKDNLSIEGMCELISTKECQEGINSFIEKRKPNW